jgi:flagellar basal-body rod protein FlgC
MPTLLGAIHASATGLDAQRARLEVAASNLANMDSTQGPNNEPYRRREVVLESTGPDSFGASFDRASSAGNAAGVRVADVIQDQSAFSRRYDPSHPDADADGFVAEPDINVADEMVNMVGAARAYQANLSAITLIRDTIAKALELAK